MNAQLSVKISADMGPDSLHKKFVLRYASDDTEDEVLKKSILDNFIASLKSALDSTISFRNIIFPVYEPVSGNSSPDEHANVRPNRSPSGPNGSSQSSPSEYSLTYTPRASNSYDSPIVTPTYTPTLSSSHLWTSPDISDCISPSQNVSQLSAVDTHDPIPPFVTRRNCTGSNSPKLSTFATTDTVFPCTQDDTIPLLRKKCKNIDISKYYRNPTPPPKVQILKKVFVKDFQSDALEHEQDIKHEEKLKSYSEALRDNLDSSFVTARSSPSNSTDVQIKACTEVNLFPKPGRAALQLDNNITSTSCARRIATRITRRPLRSKAKYDTFCSTRIKRLQGLREN